MQDISILSCLEQKGEKSQGSSDGSGQTGTDPAKVIFKLQEESYGIYCPQEFQWPKAPVGFRARKLSDIKHTPFRLEFRRVHSDAEMSDEWYKSTFEHLFVSIRHFSRRYFGNSNNFTLLRSPWTWRHFHSGFIQCASQVACSDPTGNWDALLADHRQRESLVVGIISKILMDTVFTSLLWGASPEQMDMLKVHDETTLGLDGYERTSRRSLIVKGIMGDRILTPQFWPQVERAAIELTSFLLPLINLQGHSAPYKTWATLDEIHEQLFHIVSLAAYFSLIIRRSETVIRLELPSPGTHWSWGYEEDNPDLYQESKLEASKQDCAVNAAVSKGGPGRNHKRPASLLRRFLDSARLSSSNHNRMMRIAKVKIALFPYITRHKPSRNPNHGMSWEPERETDIFKGRVVYYHGRDGVVGNMMDRQPTLEEHRRSMWKRVWHKCWPRQHIARMAILLTTVMILLYMLRPAMFWEMMLALCNYAIFVHKVVRTTLWAALRIRDS